MPVMLVRDDGSLRDRAMLEAQRLVEKVAAAEDYVRAAQRQTEVILGGFHGQAGWTVEVVWTDAGEQTAEANSPAPLLQSDEL